VRGAIGAPGSWLQWSPINAAADDDSATTLEESAALRPWTDPLPHPTTTIPMTAAHAAMRRVAFI
jgi:hypothetical protein